MSSVKDSALVSGRKITSDILTGHERFLGEDETIVSKTDVHGNITYVNPVFMEISGFSEKEMLGAPHSVIRHPDTPRVIFKLLWETVMRGNEIFAYVVNRCKNGDHYWVLAHITPSYDPNGKLIGYHSNRRIPHPKAIEAIKPIYRELCAAEKTGRKEGLEKSSNILNDMLEQKAMTYQEFVFSLIP